MMSSRLRRHMTDRVVIDLEQQLVRGLGCILGLNLALQASAKIPDYCKKQKKKVICKKT